MGRNSFQIANLQALRGVAILLVVAFHLLPIEGKYAPGGRVLPFFLQVGASGVDLFFVISGTVLVLSVLRPDNRDIRPFGFLVTRWIRIFPLYWLYSLMVLGVYLIQPAWVNAMEGHRIHVWASFLLLPQDRLPLLAVGWALIHQMYFYLGFAFLLGVFKKDLLWPLAGWAVLTAVGACLFPGTGHSFSWGWILFHPLTLEFIGGGLIGLVLTSGHCRFGGMALAAGGVAVLGSIRMFSGAPPGDLPADWVRLAVFGLPAGLMVYGAVALEFRSGFRLPGFLQGLGDASYSIYLSHVLVLSALGRFWAFFGWPDGQGALLMLAAMTVASLLWGRIGYRLVERPMLHWVRAKIRGRGLVHHAGGPARK